MSVAAMDPRISADRIYQYGDYQALAARYRRRRRNSWYQDFFRMLTRKQGRAVRLLPYKLALGVGMVVIIASVGSFGLLSADSLRLAYAKQDMQNGIAGLDQAASEAVENNVAGQTDVLTGGKPATSKVLPPADTDYVVLTNIPDVGGKQLVEQLYPLSKRVIKVQP